MIIFWLPRGLLQAQARSGPHNYVGTCAYNMNCHLFQLYKKNSSNLFGKNFTLTHAIMQSVCKVIPVYATWENLTYFSKGGSVVLASSFSFYVKKVSDNLHLELIDLLTDKGLKIRQFPWKSVTHTHTHMHTHINCISWKRHHKSEPQYSNSKDFASSLFLNKPSLQGRVQINN